MTIDPASVLSEILAAVNVLLVGAGGAVGAIARYLLSGLVQERAGGLFPWGTLLVNVAGCLVITGCTDTGYCLLLSNRLNTSPPSWVAVSPSR